MRALLEKLKMLKTHPRFLDWVIPLGFLVFVLILHWPFLFGGYTFFDSDAASYYTAVLAFYKDALKNGESIFWNPFVYSGFPTYASQSGLLDPVYVPLLSLFDAVTAYHVRLAFDYFLVLLLSFYAARSRGISRSSAILVGMGYLSVFHWMHATTMVANSLFLLPALIIAFHGFFSGKKRWLWAVLAGVSIGWSILSGNAQVTIYSLALFAMYAFLSWRLELYPAYKFWKLAVFLLLVFLLGAVLALPQILPSMRLAAYSLRSGGLAYGETIYKAIEPGDAILFLMPDYLYFPYLSGGRRPLYIGAFLFFAAVTALARIKEKKILIPAVPFLFALVSSFASPLFYLLQQLPVLGYFRNPQKWMFAGAFFAALLAAAGFDRLKTTLEYSRERLILLLLGIPVFFYATAIFLFNAFGEAFWRGVARYFFSVFARLPYQSLGFTKDLAHYQGAFERGILAWREFSSFADPYFLLPFLALIASYAVLHLFLSGRLSAFRFTVLGAAVATLTFAAATLGQFSNRIQTEPLLLSQRSFLDKFLSEEDSRLYRTYPFMLDAGFIKRVPPKYQLTRDEASAVTELKFAASWPNTNLYSRHVSLEGYDPLIPKDMAETFALIGNDDSAVDLTRGISREEKIRRFMEHLEVVGMMGVKYVISGVPLTHPLLTFKGEYPVSRYGIPIYVYEHKGALPKIYYAREAVSGAGLSPEALVTKNDFVERTYIDCGDCLLEKRVSQPGRPSILSYGNGDIAVRTESDAPQWLIVSESNLPTWEVSIDGVLASLYRANLFYMAVRIPAGKHIVTFTYQGLLGERKLFSWLAY